MVAVLLIHQSVDLWADGQLESIGGLKFNLSTGLVLLIVVVGGAYLVENWSQVRSAPSIWPFVALVVIATISLVSTPSLSLGIPEVLRLARIGVIYGLVYMLCRSRRDIELVVGAMLISALGVIGVAIEQTVSGDATGSLGQFQFDRATGGFTGPDELGIILGVLLCFSIPLLLGGRLRWWPLLCVWIGLAGVALVGSYTRTGWISLDRRADRDRRDPLPDAAAARAARARRQSSSRCRAQSPIQRSQRGAAASGPIREHVQRADQPVGVEPAQGEPGAAARPRLVARSASSRAG